MITEESLKGRNLKEFERDLNKFDKIEMDLMAKLKDLKFIKDYKKVWLENSLNPQNKENYDFEIINKYNKKVKLEVKTIDWNFSKLLYFNITKKLGEELKRDNIFILLLYRKTQEVFIFDPSVKMEKMDWKGLGYNKKEGYKINVKSAIKKIII